MKYIWSNLRSKTIDSCKLYKKLCNHFRHILSCAVHHQFYLSDLFTRMWFGFNTHYCSLESVTAVNIWIFRHAISTLNLIYPTPPTFFFCISIKDYTTVWATVCAREMEKEVARYFIKSLNIFSTVQQCGGVQCENVHAQYSIEYNNHN